MPIAFGRRVRGVRVYVPPGAPAWHHLPLVLVLHGAGGSGPRMERYSGFSRVAASQGFITVYPDAAGPVWNITASPQGADDVGFLSAVITAVQRTLCVNRHRIFVAGVSNGGGMAALLGCALSTRLAAIAPVAGDYDGQPPCHPRRPISVLEIHGTADQVAPYFGRSGRTSSTGPPPLVTIWAHRDGCSSRPSERRIATRTVLYRWGGCSGSTIVEHIRIDRGRHQWPGAVPPDPGPPPTICTACTIWSFFASLPTGTGYSGGSGLPG